jgi:phosphoglycolate phosphatase-like HAD superfamily hydrolase
MPLFAMKQYADSKAIMIGDRSEDREAAQATKIPYINADAWREGSVVITPSAFIV